MEVVNILPTPVAIIPCPFHSKVKDTILAEIEEQEVNIKKSKKVHDKFKIILPEVKKL